MFAPAGHGRAMPLAPAGYRRLTIEINAEYLVVSEKGMGQCTAHSTVEGYLYTARG